MGADTFWVQASGKTAAEAFKTATEEARYENGHRGYTGTIAEKRDFIMLTPPAGMSALDFARSDEALDKVDDKWGPAGCVALGKGKWVFFGWASS